MRLLVNVLLVGMMSVFLCSCSSSRIVEDARVDSFVKERFHVELLRDTFIQHDTHYIYEKGDTLRDSIVRDRYHIIYKVERDTIQDTIYSERTRVDVQKQTEPRWRFHLGVIIGFCAAVLFVVLFFRIIHPN